MTKGIGALHVYPFELGVVIPIFPMGKLRLRRVAICPMPRSQGVTELASKPDGVAPEPTRLPPCDAWDRSARDLHGKPTKRKLFARDSERARDFAQGRTAGQGFNAHRWLGRKARVLGTRGESRGASLLASFTHIGLSAALRNLLLKCKAVLQLCFVKA